MPTTIPMSTGNGWFSESSKEIAMLIMMKTVPAGQDPRIVIACIRACIWARVEGWPFSLLK